ncbi:MAG: orotate phosphoribosyltransferase [Nitrosomonadales bacterium]|jgi:orotate phosphoribosyltransferase|nr:orotate phosphoribosyltransferase [Nitrosomonadales bacterium]MBT4758834.1 orotate phosphoribosyltransferase [Nitrosomonadales bacterium]MBT5149813.1 orotate phosphoribosyltransferase [Nitrosomonadales bacterium]MBT5572648.1 orotate phosphoribosyltransferase [Nitrosomonadales bacterium]MBT6014482.1 orotate phosphoribosyltransferase [Nitrosomonadales bacterium]
MRQSFIKFALEKKVLRFGDFTTKAGRKSPYFFNLASFNDGDSLKRLGDYYAEKIIEENIEFDILFGPAYKGISLVGAIAISLSNKGINKKFSSNRKEVKDHGEGGLIIGAPISGKILIIDDVISAGTSIKESFSLINSFNAEVVGILVSIDRKEKGSNKLSAIEEIYEKYQVPVSSIIDLDNIIDFLKKDAVNKKILDEMLGYREKYGV